MNILQSFKKAFSTKNQRKTRQYYGNWPIQNTVTAFSGQIQDHLLVQSCISSIATQMMKLVPHHVIKKENGEVTVVNDAIERVLQRPNPYMTMPDLVEKLVWTLMLDFNAYVYPVWSDANELLALWPIPGKTYEYIEDASGRTFLKVTYADGTSNTFLYTSIIHLRHRFSLNEFFGGNAYGSPDVKALQDALGLTDVAFDTIESSLEISKGVLGIYKTHTFLAEDGKEDVLRSLNEMIKKQESGIIAIDEGADFVPVERKPIILDEKNMQFLEDRILRYFGVSNAILSGDFTGAQKLAFYDKTLEPLCVKFSEAFSKGLFSMREQTSFGHRIHFYASRIEFMSDAMKMEMVRFFGDRGAMFENEARGIFNLPPIPELDGVRMQSLNYIDTDKASEYQLSQNGLKKTDKEKES